MPHEANVTGLNISFPLRLEPIAHLKKKRERSKMGYEFKSIIFFSNELMSLVAWVHVVDGLLL